MAILTPLDIESKTFSFGIGYSAHEVKNFVREVLVNYEKLYKENIELKDKISLLNEGIQYYKTIEQTLQNTLILAEKTAEETKALARKRAEQIEKEGELKAQNLLSDSRQEMMRINQKREELIRQYDASKIQLKQFLKIQLEMVEKNEFELLHGHIMPVGDDYLEDIKTNVVKDEIKSENVAETDNED